MAITLYYYFFTIGIKNFSEHLFIDTLKKRILNSKYEIPLKPIITFITLLVYCSLSNLILLIPLLLRFFKFSNETIFYSNSFSQYAINISSIVIFVSGFISTIGILLRKKSKKISNDSDNLINNIHIPLITSFLIYFLLAPKNPDLMLFDTGYYHYPAIKFLSTFGLGIGSGSFFSGYGIYNLQFFGQLPFHNIFTTSENLSPSLNIIFLATYFWFFLSEYLTFKNGKIIYFSNINYKNIVLIYFLVSSIFCSSSFISTIASFSANIPIFITGSITFYIIFSSSALGKRHYDHLSIFLLTFFAPLLKTSAITICFLSTGYLIIYIFKVNKYGSNITNSLKNFFFSIFNYAKNKKIAINLISMTTICYLVAILTNIIRTGYLVFPSALTGPIGDHAINLSQVNYLKELILSWHRYSGNLSLVVPSSNFFEWFPYFIRSRNGIIASIYWIFPLLISLGLNFLRNQKQNIDNFEADKIFKLKDHVILISIFSFLNILFLIPAPSYTPWLTPIIIFLTILSYNSISFDNFLFLTIKKYFLFFVFTFLVIISLKFSYSNQVILNNLFQVKLHTKFPDLEYKIFKYKPKKWIPIKINEEKSLKIYVSQTNQCWNIPAPCITKNNYENLIK